MQLPFPDTVQPNCAAVNSQGVIFVGTQTADYHHEGVFRSYDHGNSWQLVLATGSFGVQDIAISNEDNIYAGTSSGLNPLITSTDNGLTWEPIEFPYPAPVSSIDCIGPDTIYVGSSDGRGLLLHSPDQGNIWDTAFLHYEGCLEQVSGFELLPSGEMVVGMLAFYPCMGGLYKSNDNGVNWNLTGLYGSQIDAVTKTTGGDLFVGIFQSFSPLESSIYALYHDSLNLFACPGPGPAVNSILINSVGDIFAGCSAWQTGLSRSNNNGNSFELVYTNLSSALRLLTIDKLDYLYAIPVSAKGSALFRSVTPTYTSVEEFIGISSPINITVFPNPVSDILKVISNYNSNTKNLCIFTITDMTGSVLKTEFGYLGPERIQLDVNSMKPGIYMLIVNDAENVFYKKFVKL